MKRFVRPLFATSLVAVLACCLLSSTQLQRSLAQESAPATKNEPETLAEKVIGTWRLEEASTPGSPSGVGTRLKLFTGTHWCVIQPDPDTGVIVFQHGGSYEMQRDTMKTNRDFAGESTKDMIGGTGTFAITIDGDTMKQADSDGIFHETWKRVKLPLPEDGITQAWRNRYADEAKNILVYTGVEGKSEKLERAEGSVLDWKNDVRFGNTNGSVFVWTRNQRVDVIGTVFSHASRDQEGMRLIARSMLKLREDDAWATVDDQRFWDPTNVGLLRGRVADQAVDKTRAARLQQMVEVASSFSSEIVDYDGTKRALRLLKQPIYRYDNTISDVTKSPTVLDGGLFVFATEGTDPEVMLLLEAVGVDDKIEWQFSLGRFTTVQVTVSQAGTEIWSPAKSTIGSNYKTQRFGILPENVGTD